MERLKNNVISSPYTIFYIVIIIAIGAIVILYDNQFNKQIQGSISFTLPFQSIGDRGYIFFSEKDRPDRVVAATHFGYNLNISPLELGDVEEIYEHLNEEILIDKESFFISASKESDDEYEVIKRDIDKSVKERIQKRINNFGLRGVWLESFKKREYLEGSLGAHVIGFVSVDKDDDVSKGKYGVESIFNDVLGSANVVTKTVESTFLEQIGETNPYASAGAGNIVLTIDINAQKELETQLKTAQKRWKADKVGGIIMDPHTGAILAMGITPTFDLNNFNKITDNSLFNNSNVESVYEMGSVFKALTTAIALDSGRVSSNATYTDRGQVIVDGKKISNYDGKGRGENTTIQTIISESLNTGAVFLVQETGSGTYKDYIDEFRFNGVTQIDLPKEIPGLVGNLDSNREIEFATASFGQGIAVTPIAAIRAFASLANNGFIVQPYVVKEIQQPRVGGIITGLNNTRERKRIFKDSTTKQVTELLINTYDRNVLGGSLRNSKYSIAAKTGTAQVVDQESGGYAEDGSLHSFFGYFPARNPKFIVFLYALNSEARFAGTTLAQPFSNITDFLISYYAVPPDR